MAGREFEVDVWRDGMYVRDRDGWMDEEKNRQESWEYYSVGERAEFRTRMNTECTRGCMDV